MRYKKKGITSFIWGLFAAAFIWLLAFPAFRAHTLTGSNYFSIRLNGTEIGGLGDEAEVYSCLREARRRLAGESGAFVLAESELEIVPSVSLFGHVDSRENITQRMTEALESGRKTTLNRSYSVKINNYTVNLRSMDDVYSLIAASKQKYDGENAYDVNLTQDESREINVLTASVVTREEAQKEADAGEEIIKSGFERAMSETVESVEASPEELDFSAFNLGLTDISLGDKVEIVETYVPAEEITDVDAAISEVTKDTETNKVYEVVSGDTLSTIADRFGLTVGDLVAMNPGLTGENPVIRVADELVVTVPEPLLTVTYTMQEYLEESFNAEVQYVDNDDMYLDERNVIREPVTGQRRIIALIDYSDETEVGREVVKEEITKEAVAAIIERGTKARPTYIKPISGGSVTSGFGYRSFRGSEFHAGTDWGVPTGTSVFASSAGTVASAGWGGGYGYCVFINHPDGRQTRYAHLSRVLVSAGQYVNQLDKIGLSGSTGDSTGPHLHFEMRIGGQAVNALDYIEW